MYLESDSDEFYSSISGSEESDSEEESETESGKIKDGHESVDELFCFQKKIVKRRVKKKVRRKKKRKIVPVMKMLLKTCENDM